MRLRKRYRQLASIPPDKRTPEQTRQLRRIVWPMVFLSRVSWFTRGVLFGFSESIVELAKFILERGKPETLERLKWRFIASHPRKEKR